MFNKKIQSQFETTLQYLCEVSDLVDKYPSSDPYAFYLDEEFNNIADDAAAILGSLRKRANNLKMRLKHLNE